MRSPLPMPNPPHAHPATRNPPRPICIVYVLCPVLLHGGQDPQRGDAGGVDPGLLHAAVCRPSPGLGMGRSGSGHWPPHGGPASRRPGPSLRGRVTFPREQGPGARSGAGFGTGVHRIGHAHTQRRAAGMAWTPPTDAASDWGLRCAGTLQGSWLRQGCAPVPCRVDRNRHPSAPSWGSLHWTVPVSCVWHRLTLYPGQLLFRPALDPVLVVEK